MQAFLMTHGCSVELVAPWHMKVKIQMGLKGVVQIHGQFACQSSYLAFTRLHVETSKPHSAGSWGRYVRGGIAVGYSAFSHLPLKFLLLVTVRQSMVDEKDCFSSWTLTLSFPQWLSHPVIFAFHTDLSHWHPSQSLLVWGITLMNAGAHKFLFHTSRAAAPAWLREEK